MQKKGERGQTGTELILHHIVNPPAVCHCPFFHKLITLLSKGQFHIRQARLTAGWTNHPAVSNSLNTPKSFKFFCSLSCCLSSSNISPQSNGTIKSLCFVCCKPYSFIMWASILDRVVVGGISETWGNFCFPKWEVTSEVVFLQLSNPYEDTLIA